MTNRPAIGLVLAVFVEAAHWVRLRWDFDHETCGRTWQFTSIGIGLATALIWLDGDRFTALPNLLTWMPPLLLPMQFIQAFGLRESLPLNTFSFLAKQHQKRNRRLGLTEAVVYVNFGNIYFISTMIASTLGSRSNANTWGFLAGTVTLTGWMLLSNTRSRPMALILALLIASGMAVAGQLGLQRAQDWISGGGGIFDPKFNPNTVSTLIGRPGLVVQSPDIVWRLRPFDKNAIPSLLRTATYNTYRTSTWENQKVAITDFKDLDTRETSDGDAYYLLKENADLMATRATLPRFSLRGAAAPETPLPLPGDAASLRDFVLDGIERNSFGCIRVFPKESVIDGTVLWQAGTNPEKPPFPPEDLKIPISEQKVIRQIAEEIGLVCEPAVKESTTLLRSWSAPPASTHEDWTAWNHGRSITRETDFKRPQSLKQKLTIIHNWFQNHFKYSRNLTIYSSSYVAVSPTGIAQFLTRKREGHCEYFATATTLLLRESGVPTRYATGYAVTERDTKRGEFVIRGTHGHAWCRVWDQHTGLWFDFDTTPPDWLGSSTPVISPSQWFDDGLKRLREDFFLWRNKPSNHLAVTLVMSTIALGVGAFVAKRLWKSKHRVENFARFAAYEGPLIRTPLHDLEPQARKQLGYRPLGQPYAEWLTRLLPFLSDPSQLEEAINLHQRLRFDPQPMPPEEKKRLVELAQHLSATLKRKLHRAE
ncbi:MAG: transglutaminase-like domain-containing protein [Luteolibacter sp.]